MKANRIIKNLWNWSMKSKPCVVIISLYKNDTLPVVEEMFQSLFNQTVDNFDIFVQEDGPLPQELENYLAGLYQNHKITSLSKRQENRGLAYSLNELVERALALGYTYIFRMDGDDIAVANRIELQSTYLDKHPKIDVLGGWIEEFNTDSGETQTILYPQEHTEILHHMVKRNPMAHVTVAFRADFFNRFGRYDPDSKNEDFRLWVDAFNAGARFHNLQSILVKVRTNNAFYTRRKNRQRAMEVMKIKFDATKRFHFGIKGYLYAIAHYLLFMAPGTLKQLIYKYFR